MAGAGHAWRRVGCAFICPTSQFMDASSGFGKKYGTASTLDEVLAAASEPPRVEILRQRTLIMKILRLERS
jgi:hypothetical protein